MKEQYYGANTEHPDIATTLDNLGSVCQRLKKFKEAEKYTTRALDIFKKTKGSTHPSTAKTLGNLAHIYHMEGRFSETQKLLLESLAIFTTYYKQNHPDTVQTYLGLAFCSLKLDQFGDAIKYLDKATEMNRALFGNEAKTTQDIQNLRNRLIF